MAAGKIKDFDRFIAEREDKKITVRIFGRECKVPSELPWHYMLKVEGMLNKKLRISGEDNMNLLKQMFAPDDFEFIINNPDFRASYVWELIAYTWLRDDEADKKDKEPVFRTEDDVKVEKTQAGASKKGRSAR